MDTQASAARFQRLLQLRENAFKRARSLQEQSRELVARSVQARLEAQDICARSAERRCKKG